MSYITFDLILRPLYYPVFEKLKHSSRDIIAQEILNALCTNPEQATPSNIAKRYQEIIDNAELLLAAPEFQPIVEKIIWPLKSAIASYLLENYLGTISLCGLIAEIVTVLHFEISRIDLNGQPLDKPLQDKLFGQNFEKLPQERRLKILYGCNILQKEAYDRFLRIKEIRNRYLHLLSIDYMKIAADAVEIFNATLRTVDTLLDLQIVDHRLVVNPKLIEYMGSKDNNI